MKWQDGLPFFLPLFPPTAKALKKRSSVSRVQCNCLLISTLLHLVGIAYQNQQLEPLTLVSAAQTMPLSSLSLNPPFFSPSSACNCNPVGSADLVCEVYSGQCPCITAAEGLESINGRQCNLCPFFTYLVANGCTGQRYFMTRDIFFCEIIQ